MTDIEEKFRRDAFIVNRSVTLADIAEQLLQEDAGGALVKAAILSWERQYGRAGALSLVAATLIAVHQEANASTCAVGN
ncbi:hypothetical protein [Sphingomonas sp. SAFR-052]|uniref:hypothetical protein n=1 Tax=Sphingomonas sp. SAFR-052 TaxID=3436867 RepID=UPI003F7FB4DD